MDHIERHQNTDDRRSKVLQLAVCPLADFVRLYDPVAYTGDLGDISMRAAAGDSRPATVRNCFLNSECLSEEFLN